MFKDKSLLMRCAELSRFFDPNVIKNDESKYYDKGSVVDAQDVFCQELVTFNPDNVQADCSEFLSYFLDLLHEELKVFYVPNKAKDPIFDEKKAKASQDDQQWNETGNKVKNVVFKNEGIQNQIENSIIRDIFGGILRTEFHVDGSRSNSVSFDPCFVLTLDILEDECSIEDCLDAYFTDQKVEGYKIDGKPAKAHKRELFEKLPNILMINLKRFIYTDKLIKKKEHVYFEDVLTIKDEHVSNQLQLGIFKKASDVGTKRNYRLFSVVEHIGKMATRGHYVCYTLGANNDWIKFDDKKFTTYDSTMMQNNVQAYMLFYELI